MKVLYLTIPSYFDLEISLIRELKSFIDIKVIMIVSPASMHSSAFSIDKLDERCSIIPASEYHGMDKYKDMIDMNDWYIANNPDNSIRSCYKLSNAIKKNYKKGDYIFLHNTSFSKEGLFLLPWVKCLKNKIMTKHDPIPHDSPTVLERVRLSVYHNAYKNLLFLSDALLEPFCAKYKYNKSNIYFSHLSVYDFLTKYPDAPNEYGKYVLFFGRITEYKGVGVLIEAFEQSNAKQLGYKLVIAGKGTISKSIEGNKDIILLNRYIPNEELAGLIKNCQFVVLPYRTATQSGCVMSAYAFNKPILATSVGDLPKEVVDGVTGYTCKPNDVVDLSNKLNVMFSMNLDNLSNNIAIQYGEDGPKSWKHAAEFLTQVYSTISKQ